MQGRLRDPRNRDVILSPGEGLIGQPGEQGADRRERQIGGEDGGRAIPNTASAAGIDVTPPPTRNAIAAPGAMPFSISPATSGNAALPLR